MSQNLAKSLLASPAILGLLVATSTAAQANPVESSANLLAQTTSVAELTSAANTNNDLGQVTSVSQLSDVQPTDWAFQALQSLVERYGCIAGYPDGTFRGNRAATRYELAAALNACLDSLDARFATQEDLAALKALQDEFAAELATLRGRVDSLEARTKTLEAQQFSTTTKLNGEVLFSFAAFGASEDILGEASERTTFSQRTRLSFDSSFSGKDRLRIRLEAANVPNLNDSITGSNSTRLGFDGDTENVVELDQLEYRFDVGRARIHVAAAGARYWNQIETFNPFFTSSGSGALSRFGRFNPIYRLSGDVGATLTYKFVDNKNTKISGNIGYLVEESLGGRNPAATPTGVDNGFIGGPFGALAQLDIQPVKNVKFGITYLRSQNVDLGGGTGNDFANNPFGSIATPGVRTVTADSVGLQGTFRVAPKFTLSGWAGYTWARLDSGASGTTATDAQILNWAATFAFPDIIRKGDLIGLIVGQPPYVIETDALEGTVNDDPQFLVEGQYQFRVNKRITITPGVIAVFNPQGPGVNGADGDDVAIVGVIRTRFSF